MAVVVVPVPVGTGPGAGVGYAVGMLLGGLLLLAGWAWGRWWPEKRPLSCLAVGTMIDPWWYRLRRLLRRPFRADRWGPSCMCHDDLDRARRCPRTARMAWEARREVTG